MLSVDEDLLICDLAETYGIYDYRSLPVKTVAALSVGLKDDSRIKMKMAGMKIDFNTMLLAKICDDLNLLVWIQTKDGQKNRNQPISILAKLLNGDEKSDLVGFESADEFEAEREKLLIELREG